MISENIKLRALEPSDVQLLFEWENDLSIWHLSNTIAPFSKFDLEQYILNSDKDIYSSKQIDRKSTRLNSSHRLTSRMPSSA